MKKILKDETNMKSAPDKEPLIRLIGIGSELDDYLESLSEEEQELVWDC